MNRYAVKRPCAHCLEDYATHSPLSRFCSNRCRQRAYRDRKAEAFIAVRLKREIAARKGAATRAARRAAPKP